MDSVPGRRIIKLCGRDVLPVKEWLRSADTVNKQHQRKFSGALRVTSCSSDAAQRQPDILMALSGLLGRYRNINLPGTSTEMMHKRVLGKQAMGTSRRDTPAGWTRAAFPELCNGTAGTPRLCWGQAVTKFVSVWVFLSTSRGKRDC